MGIVQKKTVALLSLLGSIRCSMKRRDIFDAVNIELGLSHVSFRGLNVETRCSSIFTLIRRRSHACGFVITVVSNRKRALRSSKIFEQ